MFIELPVQRLVAKTALLASVLACCALLALVILSNFVIDAFGDKRASVSKEVLEAASPYFPSSSRLHARLAEAEMEEDEPDLELAQSHAQRAVELSPCDYNNRVLLAYIMESRGDRTAAEVSLRMALRLAPHHKEVHWRLANLLLRQGKLTESADEFRVAVAADAAHLPNTLELMWRTSRGNVEALNKVTGNGNQPRLALAQFLLERSRISEAASIFSRIDPSATYDTPEGARFLATLIGIGSPEIARGLWKNLVSPGSEDAPLVWNGGLESDIVPGFSHFDWAIASSNYARLSIDNSVAHSGNRSLRIDFTGRDTTRLDQEIKQLVVVAPGTHYRLVCFVKTGDLVTTEGPRVVLIDQKSHASIASSEAVPSGSNNWKALTVDFVTPQSSRALLLSVKRAPKFTYDEPTSGTVWMDDFVMTEIKEGSP